MVQCVFFTTPSMPMRCYGFSKVGLSMLLCFFVSAAKVVKNLLNKELFKEKVAIC